MVYEYLKKSLYELSQETGFVIPVDFSSIFQQETDNENWTYRYKSFYFPLTAEEQIKCNTPEVDFSIAHEFCHMIQDFVYKSNINLHSFTKEKYQYVLNKFFNTKDIVVTDEAYNKFKEFIKESPLFNNKMRDVMKFDDKTYISKELLQEYKQDNPYINFDYVYFENTTEIYANQFASSVVFDMYKKYNKPPEYMQALKSKMEFHYKFFENAYAIRTKNDFKNRIFLYKIQTQKHTHSKLNLITNKLSGCFNYKHYDFQEASHEISKMINQVQTIIDTIDLQYKTEKQQREVDKLKEEVKENIITRISQIDKEEKSNKLSLITFVDNFAPLEQDKYKYIIYQYDNAQSLQNKVPDLLNYSTKELVLDITNNTSYLFHTERTKTSIIADKILESDTIINNTETRKTEHEFNGLEER